MNKTLEYYTLNAKAFASSTLAVDVRPLRDRFLALLPSPAHILDAGCGAGRDSLAFKNLGHFVSAFDAVPEMVELARAHTGLPVELNSFQTLSVHNAFDGIWACASLLHVPHSEMADVFHRLANALVEGGILYCSYKFGHGEIEKSGRTFTYYSKSEFKSFVVAQRDFEIVEVWRSVDARPEREDELWINALLKKRLIHSS